MFKKIIFTFCLFLFCAGLFLVFATPTFAAVSSCEFRCPGEGPARTYTESRTGGANFASEIFTIILTTHCGYDDPDPFVDRPSIDEATRDWNDYLVSCECSGEIEVFNDERGCCGRPGSTTCLTPMGEVEPPAEIPAPEPSSEKSYEAIPIRGISLPTELMITESVPELIGKIIKAVLGIVGSLALLMFIYGGFLWLMSGGNEKNITKGRNTIIWASIGLAIIFVSYALVNFIIGSLTQ